jgi:hypothetical protein
VTENVATYLYASSVRADRREKTPGEIDNDIVTPYDSSAAGNHLGGWGNYIIGGILQIEKV